MIRWQVSIKHDGAQYVATATNPGGMTVSASGATLAAAQAAIARACNAAQDDGSGESADYVHTSYSAAELARLPAVAAPRP